MPTIKVRRVSRLNPESVFLSQYRRDVTSMTGCDGVFEKIFEIIGAKNKWCVEFGAGDGKNRSNTWNLVANYDWSAVLIEGSEALYKGMEENHRGRARVHTMNAYVASEGANSLDALLAKTPIPRDFDLLSLDIDGNDWYVWDSLKQFDPRVVCVEFNPTVPNDVYFVQDNDPEINQGNSLLALVELARAKGYELVAALVWDAVFVKKELFPLFGIADNSIDAMYSPDEREIKIFQCYDGTFYTAGERRLFWRPQLPPFAPDALQFLAKSKRRYYNRGPTLRYLDRLNHVGIVVPSLAAAAAKYRDELGAETSAPVAVPEHGATMASVVLVNSTVELLEPLGDASPLRQFLEQHPGGGIHHLCFDIDDVTVARDYLRSRGVRLQDPEPKLGRHGRKVLVVPAEEMFGTTIELEEIARVAN